MYKIFIYIFIVSCLKIGYSQGIHQLKLTANDGGEQDYFGGSVSISGDYAIIGALRDDDNGNSSGSAYIFKREGYIWIEQAKITASDGAPVDYFGGSVSLSGDYAIIGAHWDDDSGNASGSAYIFKREGLNWIEQTKLFASDGAPGDVFGRSVAISDDYVIIGATGDDDNGDDSGSAYIFKRIGTDWILQIKLTPNDGAPEDYFGGAIAVSNDYAIIGATGDDEGGDRTGSVYIFKRDGSVWTEQSKLTASDGGFLDAFGISVSISKDYAIIGASGLEGIDGNSAYIFKQDTITGEWIEYTKLTASDGNSGDQFGNSVSISGDFACVGAGGDDNFGDQSGSVYIFKLDTISGQWIEQARLNSKDESTGDGFGVSTLIDDGHVIIGASRNDDDGLESGSAYIFDIFRPFLSDTLTDQVVDEDFSTYSIANLDTVFNDLDSPSLIYSVFTDGNTIANINENILTLSSVPDFFGFSQVIVTANDERVTSTSDTFFVSIKGLNDPPASFGLLLPLDGDTLINSTNIIEFVWQSSTDVDGDMLTYGLNLYSDQMDTTIVGIQDTNFYFNGLEILRGNTTYSWSSFVTDEIVTVTSSDTSTFITPFPIPYLSVFQNPTLNNYLHFAVNVENVISEELSLTANGSEIPVTSNGINSWYGSYEMIDSGNIELHLIAGDTTLIRFFSVGYVNRPCGSGISYDNRVSIHFYPNCINQDLYFAIFDSKIKERLEEGSYEIGMENIKLSKTAKITFHSDDNQAIYRRDGNKWIELPTVKQNGNLMAHTDKLGEFKLGMAAISLVTSDLIVNYPNPFNQETQIKFTVGAEDHLKKIQLKIFNIRGQLVNILLDKPLTVGIYHSTWDCKDITENNVASGLYIYQLLIGSNVFTKKMILIK